MSSGGFWEERRRSMLDFPPPPPNRMESLRGPGFTNWVVRGHVLAGPHPGTLSTSDLVKSLTEILAVGVTTFVSLQHDMPSPLSSGSSNAAGAPSARLRGAYGFRNVLTAKSYIEEARTIAEAARLPQVADGDRIGYIHFPINEASGATTEDERLLTFVLDLLARIKAGEVLYVQCHDGNGRTGSVAALLLGLIYNMSSSEALDASQRARDFRAGARGLSPETHEQKMQIHRLLSRPDVRERAAAVEPRRSDEAASALAEDVAQIAAKIREGLTRLGPTSMIQFRRQLLARAAPSANGPAATEAAFADVVAGLRVVRLTDEESLVFHRYHLRHEGDAAAPVADLCESVRGPLSAGRRAVIHAAFARMDVGATGTVDMDDVAVLFNARKHPDVTAGRRSEDAVLREFLETFGVDRRGRTVHVHDFEEYYADLSAAIPDDAFFRLMMWHVWGLDAAALAGVPGGGGLGALGALGGPGGHFLPAAGTPSGGSGGGGGGGAGGVGGSSMAMSRVGATGEYRVAVPKFDTLESALAQLRRSLRQASDFAIAAVTQRLRALDASGTGLVDEPTMNSALVEAGLRLHPGSAFDADAAHAARLAFEHLARRTASPDPSTGRPRIDAEGFAALLRAPLTDARRRVVHRAFERLDAAFGRTGAVPLEEVAGHFAPDRYPSAVAGRRKPEEIMRDFLLALGPGEGSPPVVKLPYFEEFCEGLSAALDDDHAFSLIIWNAWEEPGSRIRLRGRMAAGGVGVTSAGTLASARSMAHPTPASIHARSVETEEGLLSSIERLAVTGKRPSTATAGAAGLAGGVAGGMGPGASGVFSSPPTTPLGRGHFAAHPAQTTSVHIVGSTAAGTPSSASGAGGSAASPYATRAGYGLGAASAGAPTISAPALLPHTLPPGSAALAATASLYGSTPASPFRGSGGGAGGGGAGGGAGGSAVRGGFGGGGGGGGSMTPRGSELPEDMTLTRLDRGKKLFPDKTQAILASHQAAAASPALGPILPDAEAAALGVRPTLGEDPEVTALRARFLASPSSSAMATTSAAWAGASASYSAAHGYGPSSSAASTAAASTTAESALEAIRAFLRPRGPRALFQLRRSLGVGLGVTPELSALPLRRLSPVGEFVRILRDASVPVDEAQGRALAAAFAADVGGGGGGGGGGSNIDVAAFVDALAGELRGGRRALVVQAYDAVLADVASRVFRDVPVHAVPAHLMRMAYDSKNHPDVVSGKRDEVGVLREFLETFFPEAADASPITRDDFLHYHAHLSFAVTEDAEFRMTLWNVWKLAAIGAAATTAHTHPSSPSAAHAAHAAGVASNPGLTLEMRGAGAVLGVGSASGPGSVHSTPLGPSRRPSSDLGFASPGEFARLSSKGSGRAYSAAAVAPESLDPEAIFKRLRAALTYRGAEAFLQLDAQLRVAESPGSGGQLTASQLRGAIARCGLGLSDPEADCLFYFFDTAGPGARSGYIGRETFLDGVAGEPSPYRQGLIDRAFQKLDPHRRGLADSRDIAGCFNAESIVEVRTGRKTPRQALRDLMAPLAAMVGAGAEDGSFLVPIGVWRRFYRLISAGIEEDANFQLLMWNTWKLGGR